ncbi:pyridoxal-phosphate dependent enzyme [Ilumatobacter nonamiensis]|uniref:pyridoxal-phosphate dependent enzyme n=1 Tax=Ilumatobacter nonamiensis TaxID=467093 RepID=UPI00034D6023|nr:pyridoxal-phosphate dependent enzyme [Ilumatobacter nonamiensis]
MTAIDAPSDTNSAALENQFGLADRIVDEVALANSVRRFAEQGITLPTFGQLADPTTFDHAERVGDADPQGPDARNLWRVHWYNDLSGNRVQVPDHVVLPPELTGVPSPIIVVFGDRFPMITAHKVLAAYSCLAPRIVTGQFDPTVHRAVWPSTGNYARGGIAISKIMASRGVAILPEGMSQERFDWLDTWCANPEEDVIKTFGTESNVKEIYDACNELAKDPGNFILNQFSEFGNHLGHYTVTGRALGHVFEQVRADSGRDLRLAAFTSATGSAGTIAAGDRLKEEYGAKTVAVEALECPTMLENGYGEHNIQGIGDKHIPLIHNVTNTDVVVAISDKATDELDLVFNSEAGRAHLAKKGVPEGIVAQLEHFGFSAICNTLAAIKTAKMLDLGPDDALITVATDGAALYPSERAKLLSTRFGGEFTPADAAEAYGEHLANVDTDNMIDCTEADRRRIFNLGYYTWVEQQGTPFELFEARRHQDFWSGLRRYVGVWDDMIDDFNGRVVAER